jgi:3D (Asp-Asp-Asp) domain-containing protein
MRLILVCILVCVLATAAFSFRGVQNYSATAYCLKGKMANGQKPHRGAVATDSLPLGTKVHIDAGKYTGTYTVKDRGVHGKRIDIWVPTKNEAVNWGRRTVKLSVCE